MAFIVLEGLDGSGKSTLLKNLQARLTERGQAVDVTREPGGTPFAEKIRNLVLAVCDEPPVGRAELLLYEAARAQHVENRIKPALQANQWVLCDRFTASSVAFQAGGREIQEADVHALNAFATQSIEPDLTILIDVSVEVSQQRQESRIEATGEKKDRLESEALEFHQKVRQSYLQQAEKNPSRWLVVDGTATPDEILQQVWRHIEDRRWLES